MAALVAMPDEIDGAQRVDGDAAVYTASNGEFGIKALDVEDVAATSDPSLDELAADVQDGEPCDQATDTDACLTGTDAAGRSVVVWVSTDRTIVLAAVAPDAETLSLLLAEWEQAIEVAQAG